MASLLHPSFLVQNGFTEGSSKYQRDLYKLKRKLQPLLQTSSPSKVSRYTDGDIREHVVQNKALHSSPSDSEPVCKSFGTFHDQSTDDTNQRKPVQCSQQIKSRVNSVERVEIIDISHITVKRSNDVYTTCLEIKDTIKQPPYSPKFDNTPRTPIVSSVHKERPPSLIDVEDIYVCTDCQPKQLLIGMELSNHCSKNPNHFNIDPLSDATGSTSSESSIAITIKKYSSHKPEHSKMTQHAIDKPVQHSTEFKETNNINPSTSDNRISPVKYLKIVPIHTLL